VRVGPGGVGVPAGHHISAAGVRPLPSHVAAIRDFPWPTTIKEVQAFLEMANVFWRILPGVAKAILPLTAALFCTGIHPVNQLVLNFIAHLVLLTLLITSSSS